MWANASLACTPWCPEQLTALDSTSQKAFRRKRDNELDSRRHLALLHLARSNRPASLRLAEEKGAWITYWKKAERESPLADLRSPPRLELQTIEQEAVKSLWPDKNGSRPSPHYVIVSVCSAHFDSHKGFFWNTSLAGNFVFTSKTAIFSVKLNDILFPLLLIKMSGLLQERKTLWNDS